MDISIKVDIWLVCVPLHIVSHIIFGSMLHLWLWQILIIGATNLISLLSIWISSMEICKGMTDTDFGIMWTLSFTAQLFILVKWNIARRRDMKLIYCQNRTLINFSIEWNGEMFWLIGTCIKVITRSYSPYFCFIALDAKLQEKNSSNAKQTKWCCARCTMHIQSENYICNRWAR